MDSTERNIATDCEFSEGTGGGGGGDHACSCGQGQGRARTAAATGRLNRQNSSHLPAHSALPEVTCPPHMFSDDQDNNVPCGSGGGGPPLSEVRLERALARITKLERQLKEVTKMNTRWQKYDREREAVVRDLTAKAAREQEAAREAGERAQRLEGKVRELRAQSEELELRWTDARVRAAERRAELERLQRELQAANAATAAAARDQRTVEEQQPVDHRPRDAKGTSADRDKDLIHMSKRVVDLKDRVGYLERQRMSLRKQLQEQADLYSQQITICLDDFKHEKEDKEKAKHEIGDLKKQLKKAEDFASSLKTQIIRYQNQQHTIPKRFHLSTRNIHKYYANSSEELDNSWDDAGYTLPSDVVPDRGLLGYDEIDGNMARPANANATAAPGSATAIAEPPPQYDDRSVMGCVVVPKTCREEASTPAASPISDLVLH